jgi:hypothetical protein
MIKKGICSMIIAMYSVMVDMGYMFMISSLFAPNEPEPKWREWYFWRNRPMDQNPPPHVFYVFDEFLLFFAPWAIGHALPEFHSYKQRNYIVSSLDPPIPERFIRRAAQKALALKPNLQIPSRFLLTLPQVKATVQHTVLFIAMGFRSFISRTSRRGCAP